MNSPARDERWFEGICAEQSAVPLPLLFVEVPGKALRVGYGANARAAVRKTCLCGWCKVRSGRTRRVLRSTAESIFSSVEAGVANSKRSWVGAKRRQLPRLPDGLIKLVLIEI
jgi:hypothetical protein